MGSLKAELWRPLMTLRDQGETGREVITILKKRSSHCGSMVMNPSSIHKDLSSIPGLAQWIKDPALL